MAIVPLLNDLLHELKAVNSLDPFSDVEDILEDSINLNLHPVDIFRPRIRGAGHFRPHRRYMPYHHILKAARRNRKHEDSMQSDVTPTVTKEGFQVCMEVTQFKPSELTVKAVDRNIVIEGKHEEREDEHGLIQRHFVRKYTLPKGYDPNDVVSTISSDGILTIKAPPPPSTDSKKNERIIQIQQTGPAHLCVKQPTEEVKSEELANGQQEKMDVK